MTDQERRVLTAMEADAEFIEGIREGYRQEQRGELLTFQELRKLTWGQIKAATSRQEREIDGS